MKILLRQELIFVVRTLTSLQKVRLLMHRVFAFEVLNFFVELIMLACPVEIKMTMNFESENRSKINSVGEIE